MEKGTKTGYKTLLVISWLLLALLLVGQTFSLVNYDLTVKLGLQESVEEVTPLGIAWLKSFALGDTMTYIPFLALGVVGLWLRKPWGYYTMFASLAISSYWPIVNLAAITIGREEISLHHEKYWSYWILLPLITIYGLWGMWYLYRHRTQLANK